MERRLAAILAADVVGYSKLVQADEAGTLQRIKEIWAEVFETNVAAHRGRTRSALPRWRKPGGSRKPAKKFRRR